MKFKQILAVIFAFSIIITSCKKNEAPNLETGKNLEFDHGGLTRSYHLYKPEGLPDNAPLIFVLHGYTSNNDHSYDYGFNAVADTAGFAVCYPQGAEDRINFNHWNARLTLSNVDDIGFLSSLAQHLQTEHNFDPNRTFSTGFSNGGYMSYTLACEASNVFKAIAPVSGLMSGYTWDNREPDATPVPVLHIHGTHDVIVPYTGKSNDAGGWGISVGAEETVEYWADLNNCSAPDSVTISNNTTAFYHRGGTGGNEVWFYQIVNHGHSWPYETGAPGFNACEVIWEFFSKF